MVGKAFRGFLLASVLTATASQVGNLIDGIMLSHFISAGAMSAINIVSPVTQVLYSLCILLGVGGTMLAGMEIGKHRRDQAGAIFSTVTGTALLLGLLLGIGGLVWLSPLVGLLCPDTSLQPYTSEYLSVILPATPVYMLMIVAQMFVTLDGSPRRVTGAVAVSMLVNLTLDYIFISWCGWAMIGAAAATVISYLAAIGVLLPHFAGREALKFRMPRGVGRLREVAAMGLPFGVATVLIAVQLLGNNLVAINYLGTPGIVTLSVCTYLLMFSMILLTGTLESFQPVASILKGSGDHRGVALVLGRAYTFLGCGLVLLAALLITFPGFIGSLFGIESGADAAMVHRALPAYAFNIMLQCGVYMLIPVYQLYGHKRLALIISVGQPLLPLGIFWLFAASGAAWLNPWWGFACGQLLVGLCVWACVSRSKGGAEMLMTRIPLQSPDNLMDISVKPSVKDFRQAMTEIDSWLKERDLPEPLRLRVELACEETLKNVIDHGEVSEKRSAVDVRISLTEREITAVFRDEGVPFNPASEQPSASVEQGGIGLRLVSKTVDEQSYQRLFSQNLLTVKWTR